MNTTFRVKNLILGLNLVVGSAVLLMTTPAVGHTEAWSEPVIGMSIGARATNTVPKTGDSISSGGAQLRIQGPVIGFEGSIDALQKNYNGVKVTDWPVMASVMARILPGSPITPFVLGGFGWYNTTVEFTNPITGTEYKDSKSRLGYHLGVGLEAFLNTNWSIDGTYRRVWVEKLRSSDASVNDKEWDNTGDMFTVGLNLHF